MHKAIGRFALAASQLVGSTYAIAIAVGVIILWAISGPFLSFSSVWQLVINTITTVTTGLIVFILQYSQNRDTAAVHVKLDEILIALAEANSDIAEIEQAEEEDVELARQHHREQLESA
jgi:low affinity Fe/Cu permease